MAKLDDLLKIHGVAAAGEFTADGKLVDFQANMDMPSEMSEMTAQDVLEGRMNVEIGIAAVRPAEFIILKFSHKLQEA